LKNTSSVWSWDSTFSTNNNNFGVGTTTPWGQLSVNPNGITNKPPKKKVHFITVSGEYL
jgi:hypothetical protein